MRLLYSTFTFSTKQGKDRICQISTNFTTFTLPLAKQICPLEFTNSTRILSGLDHELGAHKIAVSRLWKNPIFNDEEIGLLQGVDVSDDTWDTLDIIKCAFNLHMIDYVDLF